MGSSPGFGSAPGDLSTEADNALFGLAFAVAPRRQSLNLATESNSSDHSSIGTPSSALRRTSTACRHTVSGLFHSPFGVLFTFPSRYWFTIGRPGDLALGCGQPGFPQDFPCPVVLRNKKRSPSPFAYGTITLYGGPFHGPWARAGFVTPRKAPGPPPSVLQPPRGIGPGPTEPLEFGLLPVRSPLLGE